MARARHSRQPGAAYGDGALPHQHARQGCDQPGARPVAASRLCASRAVAGRRARAPRHAHGRRLALLHGSRAADEAPGADAARAAQRWRARAPLRHARPFRRIFRRERSGLTFPLHRILQRAIALYPQRLAVVNGRVRLTYRQLGERVHRLAGGLLGMGLNRGDRVAILDWNSHRYLEMYYACAHAGLAFMPINSRLALPELRYVLKDAEARALAFSAPFLPIYEELEGALEYGIGMALAAAPRNTKDYEDLLVASTPLRQPVSTELDEITQIYYTSGTTGEPKGVCLTNRNMYAGGLDGVLTLSPTPNDIWQHSGPLFHLATSFAVWSMPIVGGAQVTVHFEPKRAIENIGAENVTMTSLPGAILGLMANVPGIRAQVQSLRTVLYGGGPTPMGVLKKAAAALPGLSHSYGITETAGFVTSLRRADHVFDGSER